MRKIFCISVLFLTFNLSCFADEIQDIQCFFNQYIEAGNNYSNNFFDFYSNNAKIVRVVEKPDGTEKTVNVPFERYKSEVKKSSKLAKLRNYKNKYFNVKILPFGENYKITAMRMPSTSDYKIPAHFIVEKDFSGCWKIKEESMNTKVQKFLKNS